LNVACLVEEGGRTRRFGEADFPLSVGGAGADIVVPGLPAGEPSVFLALDGGELYAQPQGKARLSIGGTPVTASQWVQDGDELRLVATRIRVTWRGGRRYLRVDHLRLDEPTEPPALVVPARDFRAPDAGDDLVRPAAFHPRPLPVGPRVRPSRRPSLRVVLLAAALVLGGAFLAAARVVEVQVEPAPERLSVRGWPHFFWGGTRLLLPGRYAVTAERAGYRALEEVLVVGGERRQAARFVLERLPGRLALQTTPADGVRVFVDGSERGTTPLAPLDVPTGEHEVVLRGEGYMAFTARIDVTGGGELQTLTATLVPDRAPVSFASEPSGATIRVDGAEVGRTPVTVDLSSGTRSVEARLAGHEPAARRIEVVAERALAVPSFRLEPLPGRLAVTSEPAGAAVTVDGVYRGDSPLEVAVAPNRAHAVRLTKAGHDAAEASVTLGMDEARSLSLTLAPRVGEVEVAAEPADAEVFVDGESRGRVGQTLHLTAAPHEIEIRRSGFDSHRVTVTPRPGIPQAVKVRLRSQQEPKAAAPSRVTVRGHEMRLLGPGRFQMGASRREPGRRANETVREIELARPVYLAVREVTNAQFRRLRAHSSGKFANHDLDADEQPVVQVTWADAAEYCNWLSSQEGLPPAYAVRDGKLVPTAPVGTGFRLPTEAEWSRAARYPAAGPLKYPWGAALPVPPRAGNYADESARAVVAVVLQGYDDRHPVSAPVGSFPPNALGFFDLGGNVAEWVHDVYSIPPADTPLERDPMGPPPGELHVVLGSSYLQGTVTELRLSYRDYATKPRPDVGFRVARYAE
jgi:formylglycine-generating enzyme required for sulfatase activity